MPPGAQFCVSPQKAVCESVLCPQGLHLVQLVVFVAATQPKQDQY